jgi:Tfp pilus assembly protein FimV
MPRDLATAACHAGSPLASYVDAPSAAALRRRRLRVALLALVVVTVLAWGAVRASAALGDVPANVPERRSGPVTYVVQPGDTLWSVARRLRPGGGASALVHHWVEANGGAELRVGQVLVVP